MSKKKIDLNLGLPEDGKRWVKWRNKCGNWEKGCRIVDEEGSVTFEQCGVVVPAPEKYFELSETGENELIAPAAPAAATPLCEGLEDGGVLVPGDKVVVCVDGDGTPVTKTVPADEDTTYSYEVTNDFDGDGVMVVTVTATKSDGTTTTQEIAFAETPDEAGQYFSGQPTITAAGLITFPTAVDEGEAAGTPITLDLSALISSPHPSFTGTGATTATFDAGTNSWIISSTDVSADLTSVTNADGSITHTFQDVDAAGNPVGSPVTFTTGVDADVTVVRSGPGYREYSDGRVTMWGNATFVPGSQDIRVGVPLPVSVNKPIEYFGDHISLQDVTWAGAPGEPLPTTGANNGIADREHETDMGWAPSTVAPNDEFIIIAYQQENLPGENIGLISWKLTLEGGLA